MTGDVVQRIGPLAGSSFWWAVGIEDTFVTSPYPRTGRSFDAYALTGHDKRWASDLDLIADLGVSVVRYGLPWPRVNPSPGQWDWAWTDRAVERLLERGITPIVDLVHYGTPPWLDGSFQPRLSTLGRGLRGARGGTIPRTGFPVDSAQRAPDDGPALRADGHVAAVRPLLARLRRRAVGLGPRHRGVVKALAEVDDANVCVHVDAANRWLPPHPADDVELAGLTQFRADLAFLALDLLSGRVDEQHPLWSWLTGKERTRPASSRSGAIPSS